MPHQSHLIHIHGPICPKLNDDGTLIFAKTYPPLCSILFDSMREREKEKKNTLNFVVLFLVLLLYTVLFVQSEMLKELTCVC